LEAEEVLEVLEAEEDLQVEEVLEEVVMLGWEVVLRH